MSFGIENFLFLIALGVAVFFFSKNVGKIRRNILLGKDLDRNDNKPKRWGNMLRVAFGQSKMVVRPVAGFFHILIYVGFVLINIEVLEILIDGIFGTHRVLAAPLGGLYTGAINFFEVLALLVIISCVVFLWRRNIARVSRFHKPEMKGWATKDGNYILIIEIILMFALLGMNAVEHNIEGSVAAGFAISGTLAPILSGFSQESLMIMERVFWWGHILGILAFLNYLPFSKHFHIILAFPNTWYAKLEPKGKFPNNETVTKEVKMMMDPNADPYAAPAEDAGEPERFGAKDVVDLNWVQLMNAYSCTECGRCTAECPANQTGKKLSPRKIMMDVRDRLEVVGKNIDHNQGKFIDDGKSLLDDHITREELWACTTCNACTEACPVEIDPLSIIMSMRQFLVMEESSAAQELNLMMTNVENNGAPWQFAQADRANWTEEM
ncbi:MAG: 4Fe-4S dicluster domain-containing protein [Cryomorphaceae bacterium]|nr:4Fe-4S dicluster domain-containing protein [Cryomorphaceae bacterium]